MRKETSTINASIERRHSQQIKEMTTIEEEQETYPEAASKTQDLPKESKGGRKLMNAMTSVSF